MKWLANCSSLLMLGYEEAVKVSRACITAVVVAREVYRFQPEVSMSYAIPTIPRKGGFMPAKLQHPPLTSNQRKVMGELHEAVMSIGELYAEIDKEGEEALTLETVKTAVWDEIAERLDALYNDLKDAAIEWEIPVARLKQLSKLLPLALQDRYPTFVESQGHVQVNKR